jgi:hypothetical protein
VEAIMTTAALRRSVRSPAPPFVTLGPRQFMLLVSWLLLYSVLFVILLSPFIDRHLARLDIQAAEQAFGFRLGLVDEGQIQDWHIVEVRPGGRFARAGFHAGDVPTSRHGNGIEFLRWAIAEAARGRPACVEMWNEAPALARRDVCLDGAPDRP